MEIFKIENLSFAYPVSGREALHQVSLSISQGEYLVLCGKSGSGKTTLLRHLKSVLAPHGKKSGHVLFCGQELEAVTLRNQSSKIGFVMQNPEDQIVTDKVWHELAFGLESLGTDQRVMRLRVAEMASYFGIQSWFHRDVRELSGGQKQLLNLASIMAMQPQVLILDEPTSQLDPIAAADFLNTVCKINRELGTTVILSEHRLENIFPNADRVVVMEQGKVLADGNPRSIGQKLAREHSDLFVSLPAPMQIYYGVQKSTLPCPLTVREGRNWLSESFHGETPKITRIDKPNAEQETAAGVLEMKDVWFRYEKDAPDILKGVSLQVPANSLFAIVGGNGTGKSTTLKAACGICKPYRGRIKIFGKPLKKYKTTELFQNCLAMLPQDPQCLFVKKTVKEDLWEMLAEENLPQQEKETLIQTVVSQCGIANLLESHPYDLSGGEQQKAALAKVLLCRPKILLLDEPTKGIDNFYKIQLARIFQMLKETGTTIIMVTHDVEFCAQYADSVSMFFDGAVLTTSAPGNFFVQNSFYTTAANRMSRHLFENAVTNEDVIELWRKNFK